jgi:hypothetical protein
MNAGQADPSSPCRELNAEHAALAAHGHTGRHKSCHRHDTAGLADLEVVGSDQGAVAASRPLRLPGPPSEPDVRVATHPALHDLMSLSKPLIRALARSTAKGCARSDSGIG